MKQRGIEGWMKVYPVEFRADTDAMSAAAVGAYMRLLVHAWTSEGLPTDMGRLAHIAGMEQEEFAACWTRHLEEQFPTDPDRPERRVNEDQERVRREQIELLEKRSRAGRKGAQARWQTHANANGSATSGGAEEWASHGKAMEVRQGKARAGMAAAVDALRSEYPDEWPKAVETVHDRTFDMRLLSALPKTDLKSGIERALERFWVRDVEDSDPAGNVERVRRKRLKRLQHAVEATLKWLQVKEEAAGSSKVNSPTPWLLSALQQGPDREVVR